MEEFEPVVAEKNKFENGAKKHFLEISDCQDFDAKNTTLLAKPSLQLKISRCRP